MRVSVVCPSFFKTNLGENFRGNPKMKEFALSLMARAAESADDIAAAAFEQAERDVFLILPTRAERLRWRLKRFLPAFYFKQILKLGESRTPRAAETAR